MMIISNCYVVTPENAEEARAANEAILKIREERYKAKKIQCCKESITKAVSEAVHLIGLPATKTMVREILRNWKEED